jgi:colicin import membrane protein
MSAILTKVSRFEPRQDDKPFYGWRYVSYAGKNGKKSMERKPLTLENVLHPQEGDYISQNSIHFGDEIYLADVCRARESRLQNGLVLGDCLIDWGIPGLGNHAADISIFDRLKVRPPEPISTFRLRPSGGRCLAVVEIVSPARPDTRQNDVTHKLREYHQAHVPLYVIIDQKKEGDPRAVLAYRDTANGFVRKPLDRQGRILIRALGIRIGLKDSRVICHDAESDEELGDYVKIERELAAAKQQAREQAEALQAAQQELQQQAMARLAAESRIRELEAQLRSRS